MSSNAGYDRRYPARRKIAEQGRLCETADTDVFNIKVARTLPLLPRLMLKEAARSLPLTARPAEITRVMQYVIRHYPKFFREEVLV